jgi:lipid A 3-O-deacylase
MSRSVYFGAALLLMANLIPWLPARADPASPATASIFYGVRVGLLAHDVGGLWSNTRAEGGIDANAEIVLKKPSGVLWGGVLLPNFGVSINSRGDTSKIYGGAVWEFVFGNGLFFNTGAGLAVHDGQLESDDADNKQLGSRLLFRVPIEFGFTFFERHRLSVLFDHISNGYLADPNEGLDTLGVRYGFQF